MKEMFFVVYSFLVLYTILHSFKKERSKDHFFSPWPYYPLIFSTYFLVGSINVDTPVLDEQWLLYMLAVFGFYIGFLLCNLRSKSPNHVMEPVCLANINYIKIIFMLGVVFTLYIWGTSGIPFLSENVDDARMGFASNGYIATVATCLDVATFYVFALLLIDLKRQDNSRLVLYVLLICIFVFVAIMSGSRTRIFKFIIPCVIIYHFIHSKISLRTVSIFSIVGFIVIGTIGYYRAYVLYGDDIWQGLDMSGDETAFNAIIHYSTIELSTAVYGLSLVLDFTPSLVEYSYGALFMSPVLMPLPFETPTPGMFYKDVIGGTWYGAGLAATFIAPMFSDFSFLGVILFSVFYSYLFNYFYLKARAAKETDIYSVVVYAIYYFFMIAGIRSDYVSFEFIWFIVVAYSVLFFSKKKFVI